MVRKEYSLHDGKRGAALAIRVTPRAMRNEIVEIMNDGTVKIRLTAPPDDSQTNMALITFLSNVLEISASRIDIVAGFSGRDKLVSILDLDAETVHRLIISRLI